MKSSNIRYPVEVGFYDTLNLNDIDRNFLRERMTFFNYLAEQIEQNNHKLDKILDSLNIKD